MSRISVVVPTANRPELLRTTLRSIARQSALGSVDEVIVSENLGCVETGEVCREFPELPIQFVMQDPPLPVFEHVAHVLTRARCEYVAMVCDDDWWAPGHLETAMRNLDAAPAASAHASCYVAAESELPSSGIFWGLAAIWLAAGRPDPIQPYVLSVENVLALSWVFTPFSFSALVARRDGLPDAVREMQLSPHVYYADRLLFTALAKRGPIIYEPMVDTYYRTHPGNWAGNQDPEFLSSLLRQGSDYVAGLAAEAGVDPPALWRKYLTDATPAALDQVSDLLRGQVDTDLLESNGLDRLLTPLATPNAPLPFAQRVGFALRRRLRRRDQ